MISHNLNKEGKKKEVDLLAPEQRIRQNYASQISMSKHNCFVLICRSKLMCGLEGQFIECRSIRLFLFNHTQIPLRRIMFSQVSVFTGVGHMVGSFPRPRPPAGKVRKGTTPSASDIWWLSLDTC